MGSGVLALDTVLSATFHFVTKWSPGLKRNQSRDLLRYLLCRLYDESQGKLTIAQITLAQGTLARKLGLSRQWVGILLDRLQAAGWLEYYAPVLPDGMRGSCIFRIGNQLKRLLVMLTKSNPGKSPAKPGAKKTWHFSPLKREKRLLAILEKEKAIPAPSLIAKIPLLGTWLKRGKEQTET
jgi:DNA-binding Lrp family transcriptional regulator